jgi:hypothetical protein
MNRACERQARRLPGARHLRMLQSSISSSHTQRQLGADFSSPGRGAVPLHLGGVRIVHEPPAAHARFSSSVGSHPGPRLPRPDAPVSLPAPLPASRGAVSTGVSRGAGWTAGCATGDDAEVHPATTHRITACRTRRA